MVNLASLGRRELQEVRVEKAKGFFTSSKVLLVDVSGVIAEGGGGLFSDATCSPEYMKAVLRKATDDASVKALVLRINSPGGTVTASEQIAREIRAFRKATGRPVIAQINGLGCSGAYYLAAACDRIDAQPSAIVGSIGVIAVLPKYRKLADKIGIDEVVIKSGALKDMGSGMRDMTDEERGVLQSLIDSDYAQFLDWVLACRPALGDRDALRKLADGRVYTSSQALEHKLIDRICHLDEAIDQAREAAHLTDSSVVSYGYSDSPDANIYSSAGDVSPLRMNLSLPPVLKSQQAGGFFYLWSPGW